jgi:hypothetical protein
VQSRTGSQWTTEVIGAIPGGREIPRRRGAAFPDEVRLTPVGRTGALGEAAVWNRPEGTR